MRFVREGKAPLAPVTPAQLRRQLGSKRGGDNTFAILEAEDGSYVQMLGGGVSCCAEWRDLRAGRHFRAFVTPKKVPWETLSRIGDMTVRPEETLFIDDVVEIFCAFLQDQPLPGNIRWRDVTDELAGAGIAPPSR
jgi:hypothetical protein